jgi:hypothetical protein
MGARLRPSGPQTVSPGQIRTPVSLSTFSGYRVPGLPRLKIMATKNPAEAGFVGNSGATQSQLMPTITPKVSGRIGPKKCDGMMPPLAL